MISDAPTIAVRDLASLEDQMVAYCVIARAKAADGLTLTELAELIAAAMRIAVATVDSIPADGAQKKQWVLDAVAMVFDQCADRAIPFVLLPVWYLAKPAARQLVLTAASGAIEALLPFLRGKK
jgi:hypothetical protein